MIAQDKANRIATEVGVALGLVGNPTIVWENSVIEQWSVAEDEIKPRVSFGLGDVPLIG